MRENRLVNLDFDSAVCSRRFSEGREKRTLKIFSSKSYQ